MGFQNVIIRDETMGGETLNQFALEFLTADVSVADIIRERVRYEVDAYNRKKQDRFAGLIQPTGTEKVLNSYAMKTRRKIDSGQQIETALKAFTANGYILLINDVQAESLEQRISLLPDMSITFLKLTPLVGG
ncbi:hypothetical protein [Litorimonas sp. WD9-15]|uniref:hypothetical protein n=1 Tax=Litorimonas sp. WD9-15 TaxID=3418716 RepID=UPI003D04D539